MGRTLYGVDLDQSPFGGLIKRLLTDEELAVLADGGISDGGSTEPGDHSDDTSESDDLSGDIASVGVGHGGDYRPSSVESDGDDSDEDDQGRIRGFVSSHKSLLLEGGAVVALLAVVGVVIWRYKDRIKGLVPDRLGGGSDAESDESEAGDGYAGTGVSPARRRAKQDTPTEAATDESTATEPGASAESDVSARRRAGRRPGRSAREASSDEVASAGDDVDLGALVGLGTLALIAAVVRKFGEDRPHDPLVDGPEDEQ